MLIVGNEDILFRYAYAAGMAHIRRAIHVIEEDFLYNFIAFHIHGNQGALTIARGIAGKEHPVFFRQIGKALRDEILRAAGNTDRQFACGVEFIVHGGGFFAAGDGFRGVVKIRQCAGNKQAEKQNEGQQLFHDGTPL